jgi:hypothetical protein
MILATTKVEDVDRFLEVFSTKGAEKRGQHGSKGSTVFRDPNEDNRVWVLFDWDGEGWRSFVSDPDVPGGGADRRSFLRRDRRVGRGCPTGWTAPTTRLRLPPQQAGHPGHPQGPRPWQPQVARHDRRQASASDEPDFTQEPNWGRAGPRAGRPEHSRPRARQKPDH